MKKQETKKLLRLISKLQDALGDVRSRVGDVEFCANRIEETVEDFDEATCESEIHSPRVLDFIKIVGAIVQRVEYTSDRYPMMKDDFNHALEELELSDKDEIRLRLR